MLQGLMMDRPLLVSGILEHAARAYPQSTVVSASATGDRSRYTFAEIHRRVHQLAHALVKLGVKPGDRVATLAFNSNRHLELYYATAGIGAVCHTINPRLFPDQISWIANHAEDSVLFFDTVLTPQVAGLVSSMPKGIRYVALADGPMPAEAPAGTLDYETLIAAEKDGGLYDWPEFSENTACALCYTSGTTGNPKGVLYSHRSQILHAFGEILAFYKMFGQDKSVLAVVPLFHVNAWGLPYSCFLTGTSMVLPGPKLDGVSVFSLMDEEGVTTNFGVPTVWGMIMEEVRRQGRKPHALEYGLIGGAALTAPLLKAMEEFGIRAAHGWGMTETSPVSTTTTADIINGPADANPRKLRQGVPTWTTELKLVDENGRRLPHDGVSRGDLLIRCPYVTSGYYNDPVATAAAFDEEGWFRTGDVSVIHPTGEMEIVDRSKDLIKSGGEWISSLELESAALSCPGVAAAAAIAVNHPKWSERPLLCIVRDAGSPVDQDAIRAHIATRMAKWQVPDDVAFIEALPMTATGKISKLTLRERFRDFYAGAG